MGILLAFAVGYTFGAKSGSEGFDEIVKSLKEINQSEEFHGLLKALRTHASHALRELSDMLKDEDASFKIPDLVERARHLASV
jgi:hypothetical protein